MASTSKVRIALITTGVVVAATLVVIVLVLKLGARREHNLVLAEEALRQAMECSGSRASVHDSPLPGNAWPQYEKAHIRLKPTSVLTEDNLSTWGRIPKQLVDQELAQYTEELEHLSKGSQYSDGQFPYAWGKTGVWGRNPVKLSGNLKIVAIAKSRRLSEQGFTSESAVLLFELAQFARDLGHNGSRQTEIAAHDIYVSVIEELRTGILNNTYGTVDLEYILNKLNVLDSTLPNHGRVLLNEQFQVTFGLKASGTAYFESLQYKPSWRYGGSEGLMIESGLETTWKWVRQLEHAEQESWSEELELSRHIIEERANSQNRIVGISREWISSSQTVREIRARLRILQVAIHYLLYGEILSVEDPFGSRIITKGTKKGIVIWSRGSDGIDNGGKFYSKAASWHGDDLGLFMTGEE